MIHGKKVIVVLPAYKAAKTVKQTYDAIPMDVVDKVILVDDASSDDTALASPTHLFVTMSGKRLEKA